MLRHWGVEPLLVFDGRALPSKAGEEEERAQYATASVPSSCHYCIVNGAWITNRRRATAKARGDELQAAGDVEPKDAVILKAARAAYSQSIDLNPEMAYQLIKVTSFTSLHNCR
jgi:hypothetical protein